MLVGQDEHCGDMAAGNPAAVKLRSSSQRTCLEFLSSPPAQHQPGSCHSQEGKHRFLPAAAGSHHARSRLRHCPMAQQLSPLLSSPTGMAATAGLPATPAAGGCTALFSLERWLDGSVPTTRSSKRHRRLEMGERPRWRHVPPACSCHAAPPSLALAIHLEPEGRKH